jgi:hypothetical protein
MYSVCILQAVNAAEEWMTARQEWQFYRHMPVYLGNGRLLGRTVEVGHAVEVLHVQEGRLFIRDWYIPTEAIREVTGRGVVLDVDRHTLRSSGWTVPPERYLSLQGAVPGYEYTSPADIPDYASAGKQT